MSALVWSVLATGTRRDEALVPKNLWEMLLWCLVLIVAALALGIGVAVARQKYLKARSADSNSEGAGFDIEEIESLHRGGQISREEFQTLRKATLGVNGATRTKDISTSSLAAAADDENNDKEAGELRTDADKE